MVKVYVPVQLGVIVEAGDREDPEAVAEWLRKTISTDADTLTLASRNWTFDVRDFQVIAAWLAKRLDEPQAGVPDQS